MYFVPKKHSWKYMSKTLTPPFFALYNVDLIFLYVKTHVFIQKNTREGQKSSISRVFFVLRYFSKPSHRESKLSEYFELSDNFLTKNTKFQIEQFSNYSRSSNFLHYIAKSKSAYKNLFAKSLKSTCNYIHIMIMYT